MFKERHKDALLRTAARWDALEERIKRAEHVRAEVVYPAISELRYAGRRLIDALHLSWKDNPTDKDIERFDGYIAEVENNCLRAEHDVVDAVVLFIHRRINQIISEFGLPIVNEYFPLYTAMLSRIKEVDEFIVESREDREKRPDIYTDIYDKHLPQLMDLYATMISAEEAIGKVVEAANKKDKKKNNHRDFKNDWIGSLYSDYNRVNRNNAC